jgi:3-oxoacyl-ACP reductase-like protein
MGFFSNILEKLGMKDAAAAPVITPPPATAPAPAAAPAPVAAAPAEPVVNSITMVDVVALLTEKAAKHPEKLNWKTSIVDLLKLLGLDSSLAARKELAKELYCPDDKMADSAQMNMWLHKNVLAHIAANGGNIPEELL